MCLSHGCWFLSLANLSEEVVANLPEELANGVYYGFASVSGGPVYAMVMSVGWNPTYDNKKRSMVRKWFRACVVYMCVRSDGLACSLSVCVYV